MRPGYRAAVRTRCGSCSYLLLPLIYLLVNVKIAQLGESFPITIVTFLPVLLLLYVEKISVKKLMIALGLGAGLTAFNYVFGQSLDASKYVTSTMLFVYIVIIIGMVWSIRFKTISVHNYRKILRFFYIVVAIIVMLAAMEMAQIILTGGSSLMEIISKYLIYSNSYARWARLRCRFRPATFCRTRDCGSGATGVRGILSRCTRAGMWPAKGSGVTR
jgi:putative colanic acid polymerase